MDFEQNLFSQLEENPSSEKLCCFKNELKSVDYLDFDELFGAYDTIKAITFSYDIKFIAKLLEDFKSAKIIIGGNFLPEKDMTMQKLLASTLADANMAADQVNKCEILLNMMVKGQLEFRIPSGCIDHRKIYILSSSLNGKTRVISSSANMSSRAWKGDQIEHYAYDDTEFAFNEYNKKFDLFFSMCEPLPYDIVTISRTDDPSKANAYIKKVKEKNEIMVFQHMREDLEPDMVRYAVDFGNIKGQYEVMIGDTNIQNKQGFIEISPKVIKKFELKIDSEETKKKPIISEADYPRLTFDYENQKAFIDNKELDLAPKEEEVKHDIDELLALLENFNDFVGDKEKIKHTHYKLINAVFASPFFAKVRCVGYLRNISTTSLPMFLLAASSTANCGKTFVISAILKMMSGKKLVNLSTESCKSTSVRDIQAVYKSLPVFIDEIDNTYIRHVRGIIKNSHACEENQLEEQPMILFASNDVLDPEEILRKRMMFLRFEGALPSDIDQNAYKGRGNAIISRLTNALYREYLRRMLPKINNLLDAMIQGGLDDTWYPDLMLISSETLIEIFKDYGYKIPSYIRPLTFNADYSVNATYIAQDSLNEIYELYTHEKNAFKITKKQVIIELGADSDNKNKCRSWLHTLPAEMKTKFFTTKDKYQLVIDRAELEKKLGIKFGRAFSFFHWGK